MKSTLAFLLLTAFSATAFGQVTYTWTGLAGDLDWTNTGNWANSAIPVDDQDGTGNSGGLSMSDLDKIVFSAATLPTSGIPDLGGNFNGDNDGANSSPTIEFLSGGSITFAQEGREDGLWTNRPQTGVLRPIWTVGDGLPVGDIDVTVTITGANHLMRHSNGDHGITVNSDGELNLVGSLSRWAWNGSSRRTFFVINGGTVVLDGSVGSNFNTNPMPVEFTAVGGSFTANYGGDIADSTAALGGLGSNFVNNSVDGLFEFTHNGPSFTVAIVQAPDPNYWTGTGGGTWDQSTTANFTTNNIPDPLVVDTFANATAVSERGTFADSYFSSGGEISVTTSSITIAAGGVETANIDFDNSTVSFTIDSSDANGIMGATAVTLKGNGDVTFNGTHAYSGNTIIGPNATLSIGDGTMDGTVPNSPFAINGSLVYENAGAVSLDGAQFAGNGTFEKRGTGDISVTTVGLHNGPTVITEGTLTFENNYTSSSFEIASGATLELNNNVGTLDGPTSTFTGAGTLLKTGSQQSRWPGSAATFALDSGALIDVQEGTLRGGSSANEDWTNNLADMNVAFGASFTGVEANVRIDALTGEGTFSSGFNGAGYEAFTIGVDDGSGTFDGVIANAGAAGNLVKEGTGTQILNGANTYTGSTTVKGGTLTLDGPNAYTGDTVVEDGTFNLAFNGTLTFEPTIDGTTNQITGVISGTTSTVNLNGTLFLDLSNAEAVFGNSWVIVDNSNLTVNYVAFDFFVNSSLGAFGVDAGVWTLDDGSGLWTFTEATGTLTYNPGGEAKLWTGINGGTWDASTTANFTNNTLSGMLDNTTFDVATEFTQTVGFADSFFFGGGSNDVSTSSIIIAPGGVETGLVEFINSTVDYTVQSSDANGIAGTTDINVNGSGDVTLRGTHSSTGTTTIGPASTLTFDNDTTTATSFASDITGAGGIAKIGSGMVTLLGATNYTGATTVTEGELVIPTNSSSSANDITSGATLTYDLNSNFRISVNGIYTGTGTLKKTGTGRNNWADATFAFGSGALIDVQEGTLIGGSSRNEDWSPNLSDLNIASGAAFGTAEANVYVDAVTGGGILAVGFGEFDDATFDQLTIGVDNGSGTFDGTLMNFGVFNGTPTQHFGVLDKVGSGTQTFTGPCTLFGDYTVEDGTLIFADGGSLAFYPAADGVNNQLLGTVSSTTTTRMVELNGELFLDLTDTTTADGSSWQLIDGLNLDSLTYDSTTFSVNSTLGTFSDTVVDGVWTLTADGKLWTFDEFFGDLIVEDAPVATSGYTNWLTLYPGLSDTSPGADPEKDGTKNVLEYVLDGDPEASDREILPTLLDPTGANFVFFFTRRVESATDTVQIFQYGSDLTGWTDINIAPAEPGVSLGVPSAGLQTVTVVVPKPASPDKLYGRLQATLIPSP